MKKQRRLKPKQQPSPSQPPETPEALTDAQLQQVVGGITSAVPPGTIQLPVSDEVLVNFETGTPDRPTVIGNLWNKG